MVFCLHLEYSALTKGFDCQNVGQLYGNSIEDDNAFLRSIFLFCH